MPVVRWEGLRPADRRWGSDTSAAAVLKTRLLLCGSAVGGVPVLTPLTLGEREADQQWLAEQDVERLDQQGQLTLTAFGDVSVDGRHLCATSVEEDDYWVVVHEFS